MLCITAAIVILICYSKLQTRSVLMNGNTVLTECSVFCGCAYFITFSWLMEHIQIAPVAAARSCLLSALCSSETSGCRPSYMHTRSRVCSSSAHCRTKERVENYANVTELFSCTSFFVPRTEDTNKKLRYLKDCTGAVHL